MPGPVVSPDTLNKHAPAAAEAASEVSFSLAIPGARSVWLAVFFSDWPPELARGSHLPWSGRGARAPSLVRTLVRLRELTPAVWSGEVSLHPGWCEYMFLVDGVWVLDPNALEKCPDGDGDFSSARRVESCVDHEAVRPRPARSVIPAPDDAAGKSAA
ncbi:MAG: glycogen-binding domain-containing protein [Opitutaceae bacterium]|nr:glycogen-binding domain-containing protein [Opitutaceae bacterium]